jgi:lysylphosphatidylglycerol synthetase-like protein (DUF2156 family)
VTGAGDQREGSALSVTGLLPRLRQVVRKVPFTVAVVAATLLLGLVTGAMFGPTSRMSWFPDVAYGLPAVKDGRVWTLVTGWFFALTPGQYAFGLVTFAVLVGVCEIRLGTRRTAVICMVGEAGGVLAACLIVWALSATHWSWATSVGRTRDVGFTTGMLTVVAVASATVRSPWRLRIRLLLLLYVTIAFLVEGKLSDVAHLVAVGAGLAYGQRVLAIEPGFGPHTRREARLVVAGMLVAIAAVEVTVLLLPGVGPLGDVRGTFAPVDVLIDVAVALVLVSQLRFGRRWAWWIAVVLSVLNVLAAAVLALLLLFTEQPVPSASTQLGTGLLWLVLLLLLLFNRRAFRVPMRRRLVAGGETDPDRARKLLANVGGSTMSWMTTWPETRYYFMRDGRGYVGFQRHAGVALALADPVVPAGTIDEAVREFTADAESAGLTPCLFSVTGPVADAVQELGWQTAQIAEDTIIDLPDLEFKGKRWQDIRSAVNKADKEGIAFRLTTLADEPFAVLAQVRAISEQWAGEKGLPEMGFTLGGVEEALDRSVRVGLAVDGDGSLHGVTSWLPVYAPGGTVRGWTLDVMRRRPGAFRPAMEFMIAESCLALRGLGAQFVSLSGAPLARSAVDVDELSQRDKALDALGGALEPLYGFRSLHAFKEKFQPRHERIYLAYREDADLPRIGVALTKAYLPGVSTATLVRAGLSAKPAPA